MRDRTYFKTLPTADLRRMLRNAEDRATRADTTEDYLADAFAAQEIGAVLAARATGKGE